jgi:hypothetical protein
MRNRGTLELTSLQTRINERLRTFRRKNGAIKSVFHTITYRIKALQTSSEHRSGMMRTVTASLRLDALMESGAASRQQQPRAAHRVEWLSRGRYMRLHRNPRRAVSATGQFVCAMVYLVLLGRAGAEELRVPPEFGYDANGVTTVMLRAAESPVKVGDAPYQSLVFNGNYDAPLIRTRPGGVVRITLDDQMDEFTNLHFHGMTVSPLNKGDSIFRLTNAHEVGTYDIQLPPDHSPGAYWYHSHFHKGAERQVSGGLSGPILVDGMLDPFPELKGIKERVLVLRNFQKTLTGRLAR